MKNLKSISLIAVVIIALIGTLGAKTIYVSHSGGDRKVSTYVKEGGGMIYADLELMMWDYTDGYVVLEGAGENFPRPLSLAAIGGTYSGNGFDTKQLSYQGYHVEGTYLIAHVNLGTSDPGENGDATITISGNIN